MCVVFAGERGKRWEYMYMQCGAVSGVEMVVNRWISIKSDCSTGMLDAKEQGPVQNDHEGGDTRKGSNDQYETVEIFLQACDGGTNGANEHGNFRKLILCPCRDHQSDPLPLGDRASHKGHVWRLEERYGRRHRCVKQFHRFIFTGQSGFIDLQVGAGENPHVGRNTHSRA